MKKPFQLLYQSLILPNLGKLKYQFFFERLYQIAVLGMNYGNGGDFEQSGEQFALAYVHGKLKGQEKITLFDVGANIGNYARMMAGIFAGCPVTIHCFEPSRKTFSRLLANIGDIPSAHVHNFGFGKEKTALKLFTDADLSGLASLYQRRLEHMDISMAHHEQVDIEVMDDFCQEHGIDSIDFLKLDVEGHEMSVLEGAKGLLQNRNIRFIQFEFGGSNIDSRTFFQDFYYLLKDNYRLYRIVRDGLHPVDQYNEKLEIFTTINYLAELKA